MKLCLNPTHNPASAARILLALALAFSFTANAATVVCTNLIDSLGVKAGVQRVTFTPQPVNGKLIPQAYGNQTVLPKVVASDCDTNNGFSADFIAGGVYSVTFIPANSYVPPVSALIPSNDTNRYTLNQVIAFAANRNYFVWTNTYAGLLAGSNILFTTSNGTTYINGTATGGGGGGTTYTNNANSAGFIVGSGIGTNQKPAISNYVYSWSGTGTVSNALYANRATSAASADNGVTNWQAGVTLLNPNLGQYIYDTNGVARMRFRPSRTSTYAQDGASKLDVLTNGYSYSDASNVNAANWLYSAGAWTLDFGGQPRINFEAGGIIDLNDTNGNNFLWGDVGGTHFGSGRAWVDTNSVYYGSGAGLTNVAVAPALGFVCAAGRAPDSQTAANHWFSSRRAYLCDVTLSNKIQIVFPNFYGNTEAASGGAANVWASVEYPSNTFNQVLFDGSAKGTIPNGAMLVSDPLTLSSNAIAGSMIWVRTFYTNSAGIIYQTQFNPNFDLSSFGASSGTNYTMGGTMGAAQSYGYEPVAIIAPTGRKIVLIVGDSRDAGIYQASDTNLVKAMSGVVNNFAGCANLSLSGESFTRFISGGNSNRLWLANYANAIHTDLGINDLSASNFGLTNLLAQFVAKFNLPTYVETISPYTTSTDGWSTIAGQTAYLGANDSARLSYNAAVRNQSIPTAGFLDVAAVTSLTNGAFWQVNGTSNWPTSDGLHGDYFVRLRQASDNFIFGDSYPKAPYIQTANLLTTNGNGSGLTSLNASQLTSGKIPMGRLTDTGTNLQGAVLILNTNDASGRSYTNAPTISAANITGLPTTNGYIGLGSATNVAIAVGSTVSAGNQMLVTPSANANGSTNFAVAITTTPTFSTIGVAGNVTITGAGIFQGNGSGITNINGANITNVVPLANSAATATTATNSPSGYTLLDTNSTLSASKLSGAIQQYPTVQVTANTPSANLVMGWDANTNRVATNTLPSGVSVPYSQLTGNTALATNGSAQFLTGLPTIPNGLVTNNGTASLVATNSASVGGVGLTNGAVSVGSSITQYGTNIQFQVTPTGDVVFSPSNTLSLNTLRIGRITSGTGTGAVGFGTALSGSSGFRIYGSTSDSIIRISRGDYAYAATLDCSGSATQWTIQQEVYSTTGFRTPATVTATNGYASYASNTLAPTSISFPATTVNWTNTLGKNIFVFIDNGTGVTATAIKKNGTTIFTLATDVTIPLQPNEYFSETYSAGSPTATWCPY